MVALQRTRVLPDFDEDGAFGHGDEVRRDADGAEGVGGAVVGTEELGWGLGHGEDYSWVRSFQDE